MMSCETCSEHSGIVARLNSLEDKSDDVNSAVIRVDSKLNWILGLIVSFIVGFPAILAVII